MKEQEVHIFEKLKKDVIQSFLSTNSTESKDVLNWSVSDISNFQDHLFEKTKSTISEKWFYTYFKKEAEKLPRIDMLNILSLYAGYQNWADFKQSNQSQKKDKKKKKSGIYIASGILVVLLGISPLFFLKQNEFNFCFLEDNTNQSITKPVYIIVDVPGESPYYGKTDDKGCFAWKTSASEVKFIVKSPYHKTDTIYRSVHGDNQEQVKLTTDDYALMIHYYATSNVKDWKNRRNQLRKIISDQAIIYEVLANDLGIEVYSKKDFINKLTLPTKSLKNIEIIDTKYKGNQIVTLKFKTIDND